jgi:hypothetical protein
MILNPELQFSGFFTKPISKRTMVVLGLCGDLLRRDSERANMNSRFVHYGMDSQASVFRFVVGCRRAKRSEGSQPMTTGLFKVWDAETLRQGETTDVWV